MRMKKYPKVKRLGHEKTDGILNYPVTILEKMDGANFRFTHSDNVDGVEEERLVFGSRNVVYKNEEDTDNNFEHAIEFVEERAGPEDFKEAEMPGDSVTVFGEAMHPHTLDYDWDIVPNVLIFGAWSEDQGWLGWQSVDKCARYLNLDTVPVLYREREYESPDELPDNPESEYRDGVAEGIVIRSKRGGVLRRAKLRTEKFIEMHGSAKKSGRPLDGDDSIQLANELLRKEPWIKKQIHKYENRGRTIEMSIMDDLWRDVFDDIIEEEYETIFLGNYEINTKKFRSAIAGATADELRAHIERPEASVLNQ